MENANVSTLREINDGDYQASNTIRSMVLYNSGIQTGRNNTFQYCNFVFSDPTGHISGKLLWNKNNHEQDMQAKNTINKLKVGSIYSISEFRVQLANSKYTILPEHRFELLLFSKSRSIRELSGAELQNSSTYLTHIPFQFTPLEKVDECNRGETIDTIGIITSISEVLHKKDDPSVKYKRVVIRNSQKLGQGHSISTVFFGEQMNLIPKWGKGKIIAILNGQVDEFNGVTSLKYTSTSVLITIPPKDVQKHLEPKWHSEPFILQIFPKLSTTRRRKQSDDGGPSAKRVKISEHCVDENGYGHDGPTFPENDQNVITRAIADITNATSGIGVGGTFDFWTRSTLKVHVHPSSKYMDGKNDCYKMRSNPRGVALIISQHNYPTLDDPKQRERTGGEQDLKNLKSFLKSCHFVVRIEKDLKSENYKELILDFKKQIGNMHTKPDCLFIAFLGHGRHSLMQMVDKQFINYHDDLIYQFDEFHFPLMKGKPKIFLLGSCQDFVKRGESLAIKDVFKTPQRYAASVENILICLPTSPGARSLRHDRLGTVFIYFLVEVLMRKSHNTDFLKMLQEARENAKRASCEGRVLTITPIPYGFEKKLFLNPGLK